MGSRTANRNWYLPDYREQSYHNLKNSDWEDLDEMLKGFTKDGESWTGTSINVQSISISSEPTEPEDVARQMDVDSVESSLEYHRDRRDNPHAVTADDLNLDIDSKIETHRQEDVHDLPQPPADHSHSEYLVGDGTETANFDVLESQNNPTNSDHVVRKIDLDQAIEPEFRRIYVVSDDSDPTSQDGDIVVRI